MLFIKRNSIHCIISAVSLRAEYTAYCDLRSKSNHSYPYLIIYERVYRLMNVSRIRGKEGAKYNQYFSRSVFWGVALLN